MYVVGQSLSCVQLFATPWTVACQTSLPITIFQFAQTHVHWVGDPIQPSDPLSPLLLLPSIFLINSLPLIRVESLLKGILVFLICTFFSKREFLSLLLASPSSLQLALVTLLAKACWIKGGNSGGERARKNDRVIWVLSWESNHAQANTCAQTN